MARMAVKGSLQWVLWQNKPLQLCFPSFWYACMNTFCWSFHISPTGFHYLGVHISNSFKALHKENIAKLMDPNKVDIQCCNNLPLLLVGKNEHESTMNLQICANINSTCIYESNSRWFTAFTTAKLKKRNRGWLLR